MRNAEGEEKEGNIQKTEIEGLKRQEMENKIVSFYTCYADSTVQSKTK